MFSKCINENYICDEFAGNEKTVFRHLVLYEGKTFKRKFLHETLIVFVMKGMIELKNIYAEKQYISDGMIFLLPKNFDLWFSVVEKAEILLCAYTPDVNLCSKFSIKQLIKNVRPDDNDKINCLLMDNRIRRFVEMLFDSLEDGITCRHYHLIKREEFLIYLMVGYRKEELALFFRPLLSVDIDFKDFVLTHYKDVKDVKDFARKANMSLSTFNRNFKLSFNETAQRWLMAKKAESVMEDILMTNMTFYEISEKHHFSSSAYFVTFCRRNFNAAPNDIRKQEKKNK